jgi:hypothetical protein
VTQRAALCRGLVDDLPVLIVAFCLAPNDLVDRAAVFRHHTAPLTQRLHNFHQGMWTSNAVFIAWRRVISDQSAALFRRVPPFCTMFHSTCSWTIGAVHFLAPSVSDPACCSMLPRAASLAERMHNFHFRRLV